MEYFYNINRNKNSNKQTRINKTKEKKVINLRPRSKVNKDSEFGNSIRDFI